MSSDDAWQMLLSSLSLARLTQRQQTHLPSHNSMRVNVPCPCPVTDRSTSANVAPYCCSKWGIEGMTKALAQVGLQARIGIGISCSTQGHGSSQSFKVTDVSNARHSHARILHSRHRMHAYRIISTATVQSPLFTASYTIYTALHTGMRPQDLIRGHGGGQTMAAVALNPGIIHTGG